MANGTTVKECEFKKECEKVAGLECLTKKVKRCLNREFAIFVHNRAIEKAIHEAEIHSCAGSIGRQDVSKTQLEALIMETP